LVGISVADIGDHDGTFRSRRGSPSSVGSGRAT
jgi:hypothetical protein